MSIKWKIICLSLLLIGTPIAVVVLFSGQHEALLRSNALARLNAAASNLENRMALVQRLNKERLAGILSRTQLRVSLADFLDGGRDEDRRTIEKIIGDALPSISTLESITIADLQGRVVASTTEPESGLIESLVERARSRDHSLSTLYRGPDGAWHCAMVGPLVLEGATLGVAVVQVDTSDILSTAQLDTYFEGSGEVLLAVSGEDGGVELLAPSGPVRDANRRPEASVAHPLLAQALQGGEDTFTELTDYREVPVLAATRFEENLGVGMVVKIDRAEVFGPLQELRWTQLGVMLMVFAPLLALAFFIARSIYRPLDLLREGTGIIGQGNWDHRVAIASRDEVGELSRAFDSMLENLAALNGRVVRANEDLDHFTHIAAHDLREPARQTRGLVDLLVLAAEEKETETLLSLSQDLRTTSDRMMSMIEGIRMLTKIGYGERMRESTDLDDLVAGCVKNHEAALRARGAVLRVDPQPTLALYSSLVRMLYDNLIRNALTHAREDGFELHFTAVQDAGRWILGVRNTRSTIPEGERRQVFKMFRSGTDAGGSGIGLSICKRVVDRHQGEIWAEAGLDETHIRFNLS